MIKAIIIEDEPKAANMLQIMLQKNQPDVEVLEQCLDLSSGVKAIKKHQPNIVFLDIEMPGESGLQLLEFFTDDEISFSIIFTTAFNDFAIKAFELSALDYLLKPIQIDKLNAAIKRYRTKVKKSETQLEKLILLKHNLVNTERRIAIPVSSGFEILQLNDIVYLQADGSYCKLYLSNGNFMLVSKNLRYLEDLINDNKTFYRNHRSYIVNTRYVKKVLRSNGGILILHNHEQLPIASEKIDDIITIIN